MGISDYSGKCINWVSFIQLHTAHPYYLNILLFDSRHRIHSVNAETVQKNYNTSVNITKQIYLFNSIPFSSVHRVRESIGLVWVPNHKMP